MNGEFASIGRTEKILTNILFKDDSIEERDFLPPAHNSFNKREPIFKAIVPQMTRGGNKKHLVINPLENHQNVKNRKDVYVSNRRKYPEFEDPNLNWGILVNGSSVPEEDDSFYSRPINIPKPQKKGKDHYSNSYNQ